MREKRSNRTALSTAARRLRNKADKIPSVETHSPAVKGSVEEHRKKLPKAPQARMIEKEEATPTVRGLPAGNHGRLDGDAVCSGREREKETVKTRNMQHIAYFISCMIGGAAVYLRHPAPSSAY